jgi:quercetin dioxygenase-like cupin family protein
LQVLSGVGLVGLRNERPQVIKAGDTVWIPPGEEHWHGATAFNSMSHIAIQEALKGRVAEWLEKVSDEDYTVPKRQIL